MFWWVLGTFRARRTGSHKRLAMRLTLSKVRDRCDEYSPPHYIPKLQTELLQNSIRRVPWMFSMQVLTLFYCHITSALLTRMLENLVISYKMDLKISFIQSPHISNASTIMVLLSRIVHTSLWVLLKIYHLATII